MSNWTDDQDVARLQLTAMSLRQRLRETAASIAATEDRVAETLERLARDRPHDAERLLASAADARDLAAKQRARAAQYNN
jgi:hypothetical protein